MLSQTKWDIVQSQEVMRPWHRSSRFLAALNSEALPSFLAINVQSDIYSQNRHILLTLQVKVAGKFPLLPVSWSCLG